MMTEKPVDYDDLLLHKCKELIRSQLDWEESRGWTNHDFQMLSERIMQNTGVNLSVATLKRIWGKVKYDSKPTVTTLNTLAQFLGYEHWRAFKQSQHLADNGHSSASRASAPLTEIKPDTTKHHSKYAVHPGVIAVTAGLFILAIFLYATREQKSYSIHPGDYGFSSKKVVTEGIPNSVIFDYDASAAPLDSVFIQQSWDVRLTKQVPKDGRQHTSIYYTPGYFQAKLVVAGQVVKEHNLWIKSGGWLALVKQETVPVYFDKQDFIKERMLSLSIAELNKKNISFHPEPPVVSYYHVDDYGDIRTDDYIFKVNVRSDYKEGAGICQFVNILLLLEGGVIIVPLSIEGCASELSLSYNDIFVDGKKTDLSALGCQISQWVAVRLEAKNNKSRIFVNNKLAYEGTAGPSKRIVGMIFRFQGTGSVKDVELGGREIEWVNW